jgi:hypothetical protein
MTIEIADLGAWGAATLVSEYDPEGDAIRVNARAVARVRRALGDAAAESFVALAIEHERFHRAHPHASERDAAAHAERATNVDARRFEIALAHS